MSREKAFICWLDDEEDRTNAVTLREGDRVWFQVNKKWWPAVIRCIKNKYIAIVGKRQFCVIFRVEEFRSVIDKYGLDDDLSKIAQAAMADAQRPLLAEMEKKEGSKSMADTVASEEATHEEKQKSKSKKKKTQRKVKDLY